MVGRAINRTSVAGQSQPSLSRSQAHSTLVSPFSNRASTSRRSLGLDLAGHRLSGHTSVMQPPGDLLSVLDGGTEDDRPLVLYILEQGVHDEPVALRHIDLALQVPDVVLDAVEPHFGQIDIGVDADAPHRHQLADLYGGLDVQFVGGVLEDVQDVLVVGPLRRGGQAQGEFRREVGQDLLICIGGRRGGPRPR